MFGAQVLSCRLIEPHKISNATVSLFPLTAPKEDYLVRIEGKPEYIVSFTFAVNAAYKLPREDKAYFAVRLHDRPKKRPNPKDSIYEEIVVTTENWDEYKPKIIDSSVGFDEAEAEVIRLLYRAEKERHNAQWAFGVNDLRVSLDFSDFSRVLVFLQAQDYIDYFKDVSGQPQTYWFIVTKEGFRYFEERVRQENLPLLFNVNRYFQRVPIRAKKPFVFVIMPFREDLKPIFTDVIQPTVKELMVGYDCIRADEDHEPGKIDNKVWTLIQEAEFIIAEITDHNPNVLTELGIALMFGKPVYVFSSKPLDTTLFIDVKTLLAQEYSDAEDLKKKLIAILPKK